MGRTGAVEADVSLAAVGVPDGRLVGVELALLVATILAGEGSIGGFDWGLSVAFQQHCREERRHFRQAPGFEPSPVGTLLGGEEKHTCMHKGLDHKTGVDRAR